MDIGEGVFTKCGGPGVKNVTMRQHLRITGHKKMLLKTKDKAASHDDEVVLSNVARIVEIL